MTDTTNQVISARQRWMGILAKADPEELEDAWDKLADTPSYRFLRRPELGLAMVQARAGGTGKRFNLGEMTVTRCSVQLDDGRQGHAYLRGRNCRHAELAAALDAILQNPDGQTRLIELIVNPLEAAQAKRRRESARKTAATVVDFFTMVRGDD